MTGNLSLSLWTNERPQEYFFVLFLFTMTTLKNNINLKKDKKERSRQLGFCCFPSPSQWATKQTSYSHGEVSKQHIGSFPDDDKDNNNNNNNNIVFIYDLHFFFYLNIPKSSQKNSPPKEIQSGKSRSTTTCKTGENIWCYYSCTRRQMSWSIF